jgi:hypothetical protein
MMMMMIILMMMHVDTSPSDVRCTIKTVILYRHNTVKSVNLGYGTNHSPCHGLSGLQEFHVCPGNIDHLIMMLMMIDSHLCV